MCVCFCFHVTHSLTNGPPLQTRTLTHTLPPVPPPPLLSQHPQTAAVKPRLPLGSISGGSSVCCSATLSGVRWPQLHRWQPVNFAHTQLLIKGFFYSSQSLWSRRPAQHQRKCTVSNNLDPISTSVCQPRGESLWSVSIEREVIRRTWQWVLFTEGKISCLFLLSCFDYSVWWH